MTWLKHCRTLDQSFRDHEAHNPTSLQIPVDATPASVTFASMNGEPDGKFDLKEGIVGALMGASLGAGLMLGYYMLEGFRFPLLGVGIGISTGYGAKRLFYETDRRFGYIYGGLALLL